MAFQENMNMDAFLQWAEMGGYALYVWTAYGLVFLVLSMHFFSIRAHQRNIKKKLTTWFQRHIS